MRKKIFALLISTMLVCVIAEISARLVMPPHRQVGRTLLRPLANDPLFFEYIPGAQAGDVRINTYGFRDDEFSIVKDSGEYRIVWVGDSIVEGWGVTKEHRFTDIINRRVSRRSQHIRCINLAVESYTNYQELLTLQRKGVQLAPDVILLGFCWNDILKYEHFIDTTGRNNFLIDSAAERLHASSETLIRRAGAFVERYSLFGYHLKKAVADRFFSRRGGTGSVSFDHFFNWYAAAWTSPQCDTLKRQIDGMAAAAKKVNAKFIVILFPMSFQIERSETSEMYALAVDSLENAFAQYLREHDIPVCDLRECLRSDVLRDRAKLYMDVWHFTNEGHTAAAHHIGEYLDSTIFAMQFNPHQSNMR